MDRERRLSVQEVLDRCDQLACFSEEPGRITRTFLTPPMRIVHEEVARWMRAAGMEVRVDAIGNMIGHYAAARTDAPLLLIGSHLDTVPDAGKYDGILGVLLGVAAVQALEGRRLPFAIEVLAFSEEEGIRYQTSFLGSSAVTGRFQPEWLSRTDARGISMAQAIRDFGLDPTAIDQASYQGRRLLGYLEVHIEQGPVLEALGLPVDIVEAIVGITRFWLGFQGKAGHSGTLPMEMRQDALAGAAEFIAAVEQQARSRNGLRATVGSIAVTPGAVNVVPGSAYLSLDVRHADDPVREEAARELLEKARVIAARRRLSLDVARREDHSAVRADPRLTELLGTAVQSAGYVPHRLASGAGHDAAVMASLVPMTMLFIRSPGGISHHPDEAVLPEDVGAALEVMDHFLDHLAKDPA
jgi:allantoate deiminase